MSQKNLTGKTSPLRYAIGMFGTSLPINLFRGFAAAYYVTQLGVTTQQMALITLIYTFIDALDNPIYGYLSDRTKTPYGRRKPWLIIGTPVLMISFILFFNAPSYLAGTSGLFNYMLIFYILTGTLDSLINANYGALFPELFTTKEERAKTTAFKQAFQLVAMVISFVLTPMIVQKLSYGNTSLIYGILAGAVLLYSVFGYKETGHLVEQPKINLFQSLKQILTNKSFWIFGLANAFYSAAFSLIMAAVPFYVTYALQGTGTDHSILMACVILTALPMVFFWSGVIKRKGTIKTWRMALGLLAISFIPFYFAFNVLSAALCGVLLGMGLAGVLVTMDMVGALIMDDDTRTYKVKREGLFSSISGFMNRLNGLFVSLAWLLVDRLYGFKSGEVPGSNPAGAASFLLLIFPFILMILSVVFSSLLSPSLEKEKEEEKIVE